MSDSPQTLKEAADDFAGDLTTTFRRVLGSEVPEFVADIIGHEDVSGDAVPSRVSVTPPGEAGIPLTIGGSPALSMYCYYFCVWDHERAFLKVSKSGFEVNAENDSTALFRYEYLEQNGKRLPSAHLHVHAHRDEMLFAMLRGESRRARQRHGAATGESDRRRPRLSEIHFPLGGTRMRPCVEDVLQMLIQEFAIDVEQNAQVAIDEGRVKWRERQVAALVRDAPDIAAIALERKGYTVHPPIEGHPERRWEMLKGI